MSKLLLLQEILNNFTFVQKFISENYFDYTSTLRSLNAFMFACERENETLGNDLARLYLRDRYKLINHTSTPVDIMLEKNIKLFSFLIKNIDKNYYDLSIKSLTNLKIKSHLKVL
jgi:hypothetical protein